MLKIICILTYPAAPYRLVTVEIVIWKEDVVTLSGSATGVGTVTPGGIALKRIIKQKKM